MPWKTCRIPWCYLYAPAIIKKNGMEFHDFSRIMKYDLSPSSSSSSCFTHLESNRMWAMLLETAKQSLKYSYPALRLFKNFVLLGNCKIWTKIAAFWLRKHRSMTHNHCQTSLVKISCQKPLSVSSKVFYGLL